MLEQEPLRPLRRKMTLKQLQTTQEYQALIDAAWKNQDRKVMDRLFDEVVQTGNFTKGILHGIFNFYVEQQDVDAVLKFAKAFHFDHQPPRTNWYNRALVRLNSLAKHRVLAEMKAQNIPISLMNQIFFREKDVPLDFEKTIQDYKKQPSEENRILLARCVAEQLKRIETDKEHRIFQQLLDSQILIPKDVCFLLLRYAASFSRSQFAHDFCSYIKENNIDIPSFEIYSLLLVVDPFAFNVRSLVNSLLSLLKVKTAQDRAMKELSYTYVYRKTTPPASIQQKLEAMQSVPGIQEKPLFHRLSLWAQIGNPFSMVLAAHYKFIQQAKSPIEQARLDIALLEICPSYAAHYQAIDIADKHKSSEHLYHHVYPPLFHTLLAAGREDLFQQYFEEYYARAPNSAERAAFSVTSRYGYPESLKWVIERTERFKVLQPKKKYRLLLESAIKARNEESVEKIWNEYHVVQEDPQAQNNVILFFKNNLAKAKEIASKSDHIRVKQALIQVYIYNDRHIEAMREWASIQNPPYSVWIWMMRILNHTKYLLEFLADAIKAFPQHTLQLKKAAIVNLMKRGRLFPAFELLKQQLEDQEPSKAYVDPAIISSFGIVIGRKDAPKFLQELQLLCQKYPNVESDLALKSILKNN